MAGLIRQSLRSFLTASYFVEPLTPGSCINIIYLKSIDCDASLWRLLSGTAVNILAAVLIWTLVGILLIILLTVIIFKFFK